jgi:hypothetical protein
MRMVVPRDELERETPISACDTRTVGPTASLMFRRVQPGSTIDALPV